MANEPPGPTRRTWLGCNVVATADRLVIRPPIEFYGAAGFFLLLSVLLPWLMVEAGLLDRGVLMLTSALNAAGILVERRVGKLHLGRTYTVDLDLEGGGRVRFAGSSHLRPGGFRDGFAD